MIKVQFKKQKIRKLLISLTIVVLAGTNSVFGKPAGDSQNADAQKSRQYMELINSIFDYVQRNYVEEIDARKLYEGALKGMLSSLDDPYSSYLNEKDWSNMSDTTLGNFGGVGLTISKLYVSTPEHPAYVEVASPIEDSPGFKAGIKTGDLIIAINGEDTAPMSMDDVLARLRGTVGESVFVTVKRGKNMVFERELVRAVIEVPTVKYGMIEKTAYLKLIEFTPNTSERVQEALDSFKKQKFESLIIDLRNNPGGLINSAIEIADKFIDNGQIVSTKSRIEYENNVFTASPKRTTVKKNIPIVILINRGSASASEILSGALKDNHLAYLVGDRTYGKGCVQQVIPLPNNDGFKITIANYYTPSDVNIDKIGIPPDKEIKFADLTEDEEKAFIDLDKDGWIERYVEDHEGMTENDIALFAEEVQKKYNLEVRLIRKLIRNEVERKTGTALYDLDYDIQLVEALRILKEEDFKTLVANTKTLKQLQDEAVAAEGIEEIK